MCDICRRTVCPSACPNYDAHAEDDSFSDDFCAECGAPIAFGAIFYRFPDAEICAECAERFDIASLIRLLKLDGREAVFHAVGVLRETKV